MADDKDTVGNTAAATSQGSAGAAVRDNVGAATGAGVQTATADREPPATVDDPFAYRNRGDNARKRADFMERLLIDNFFGGDVRRFDAAAGLDLDA